jgi:hypothetical protein
VAVQGDETRSDGRHGHVVWFKVNAQPHNPETVAKP